MKRYKSGIALSGGGVRGFAHLGALQAMNERGIYPEVIAGTSAGSIAGCLYADGYTPLEIYDLFRSLKFREFVVTTIPYDGFFKSTGIQMFLKKYLRAKNFEELKLPLRVIASDIAGGKAHVFSEGDIATAVAASCSVPIVFSPLEIEGNYYVDGGMFMNFPVSVIRQECEIVLGVNVSSVITMKYDKSFKYIIERTMNYMVGANTVQDCKACDYLIESDDISSYSLFDMKSGEEIYKKGYEITVDYLDQKKDIVEKDFFNKNQELGLWKRFIKKIAKSSYSVYLREK